MNAQPPRSDPFGPPPPDAPDALWLNYRPLCEDYRQETLQPLARLIPPDQRSAVIDSALKEWAYAMSRFGIAEPQQMAETSSGLRMSVDPTLPSEGYAWALSPKGGLLRGGSDTGLLYGIFNLLRHIQLEQPLAAPRHSSPAYPDRMINHWDNLDASFAKTGELVERGYAGGSVFQWNQPDAPGPRAAVLARLYASIGINHCVINNVNADPRYLSDAMLDQIATLATIFRAWGIRLWLSVNFNAPMLLDGLSTADPLAEDVRNWWRRCASRIYERVPDFGGFLVKANSEGEPGPHDYGRDHHDGANMLTEALREHGGRVIWRTFVYGSTGGRKGGNFTHFHSLDGAFADGSLLQVKHGPIDFQPNEPPHPLLGAMPATAKILELQIAQEYTGQGVFTFYWPPLWRTILDAPAGAERIADKLAGMAAIPGVGDQQGFFPHPLAAANLYAYGYLAWDPDTDARACAHEWAARTLGPDAAEPVADLLMRSYDAYVKLTGSLGLVMMMGYDHFRPDPVHRARIHGIDSTAIGRDRTATSGNGEVEHWPEPLHSSFRDPATCPERWLLFFHRLPLDYLLRDGQPIFDALLADIDAGYRQTLQLEADWQKLRPCIPPALFEAMQEKFAQQSKEAMIWRDTLTREFCARAGKPEPEPILSSGAEKNRQGPVPPPQ